MTSPDQHPRPVTDLPPPPGVDLPAPAPELYPELRRVGVKVTLREYLAELWRRREFAITVPLGQLRANNQDTVLGQFWHLLNPLLLVGVYYVVFGVILQIEERRGMDIDDYLAFLIVGVLTFNYTRSTVQSGARMIVKNRQLVQSINFPRAILPASAMVAETLAHFYAIPIMFGLLLLTGATPNVLWLMIFPIVLLQAMLNLGLALAVSRLTFHFRDVQNLLPFLLRIWFYLSGVLYPINEELIPQTWARVLLELNPAYAVVEASRAAFLSGRLDAGTWITLALWSVLGLVIGFWFFRQAESEYGRV